MSQKKPSFLCNKINKRLTQYSFKRNFKNAYSLTDIKKTYTFASRNLFVLPQYLCFTDSLKKTNKNLYIMIFTVYFRW
jgi:hypothetical protein